MSQRKQKRVPVNLVTTECGHRYYLRNSNGKPVSKEEWEKGWLQWWERQNWKKNER